MTKKTDPELLIAICDSLAGARTLSLKEAARRNGISTPTLFAWMKDPSITIPEYMGEQNITFARAMKLARKCGAMITVSHAFENRVLNGTYTVSFFQGKPVWRENFAALAVPNIELRRMLYGDDPDYLHGPDGERIPYMQWTPPPSQLVERFIEGNAGKTYGQKSKLEIDQRVNLGVTVIGRDAKPLPQPLQIIERQVTETIAREIAAPQAIEQFEAVEPETEQFNRVAEDQGFEEPEPKTAAPEPEQPEPDEPLAPVDGLSMEELELLRRARSPNPMARELARIALEKMRANAAQSSEDRIGVGRKPGSYGSILR